MGATDDELLAAWRRLADDPGDPDAPEALVRLALPSLVEALSVRWPWADKHLVEEAATDAVLQLLKCPGRYDPARSPLPGFLRMAAGRRLQNLTDREKRHHAKRIPWDGVEHDLSARNEPEEDDAPTFDHPALRAAVDQFTDADRRVLDLMRDGVRPYAPYAEALGLLHLPADEQWDEVKRAKDRVGVRLRRAVGNEP